MRIFKLMVLMLTVCLWIFPIRSGAYETACRPMLRQNSSGAGHAPQTLGLSGPDCKLPGIQLEYSGEFKAPLLDDGPAAETPKGDVTSGEFWNSGQSKFPNLFKPETNGSTEGGFYNPGHLRDWHGLRRDTLHIIGYQASSVGLLYPVPEDGVKGADENRRYGFGTWPDRNRNVHGDHDSWLMNYIQHPYLGSGYFVRAKERGFSSGDSFLYSATMSTLYEFMIEGQLERPSIQDLIATPVIGSLLGSYFFEVRKKIEARERNAWYENALLIATDPFGSLNKLIDRMIGIADDEKKTCSFEIVRKKGSQTAAANYKPLQTDKSSSFIGLQLRVEW